MILALLLAIGQIASDEALGPCSASVECQGEDARKLDVAWRSPATTAEQKAKMREFLAMYTKDGQPHYAMAASEYFKWRAEKFGAPLPMKPSPPPQEPDYRAMRLAAEAAIRQRLIDPESAQFEWPNGFMDGYWKPMLQKRIEGQITCGRVNAKNRMGGYTGVSGFLVVMNGTTVSHIEMDDRSLRYLGSIVSAQCAKMSFPAAPASMGDETAQAAAPVGIADELEKLAALRDKGVLTSAEFEAQKRALLAR